MSNVSNKNFKQNNKKSCNTNYKAAAPKTQENFRQVAVHCKVSARGECFDSNNIHQNDGNINIVRL